MALEATGSPDGFDAGLAALRNGGVLVAADLRVSGNLDATRLWERAIKLIVSVRIKTEGIATHDFPKVAVTVDQSTHLPRK